MTAFPRKAIAQLIISGKPSVKPDFEEKVWGLNLDQIESGTGKILEKNMTALSELGTSTYPFAAGTVLYSKLRPYLNKVIVAEDDGYATTELVPLRCDLNNVFPDYLAYYLRSPEFLSFANTVVAGAKMPRMVMSEFWNYEVPLPPLPEQRRIAAILDKSDVLRAKRREAIAKLDELLQSVFLEMFGDPVTNPKGFTVMPLGDVATQVTDGAHHTPERTQSGIPLLSARNVLMGSLSFSNTDFVGQEEYERLRKRCEPKRGDILISCSGSIGRVSVVRTDIPFVLVRSAALVKLDQNLVMPTFMEHQLRTPYLQGQMQMSAKSSSQANLFQKPIRELKVLVPPIALQKRFDAIVSKVAERHSDFLEAEKRLESLFNSLQAHAFSGKLFP